MLDVHIGYSFYEKLVEQLEFIKHICVNIFIFFRIMNVLLLLFFFFVSILNVFWKLMANRD